MVKSLAERHPVEVDQFEMLVFYLGGSENCPYTCTELWDMTIEDLLRTRSLVFYRDALTFAQRKDKEAAKSLKPKPN